jgi:hypothetical protein
LRRKQITAKSHSITPHWHPTCPVTQACASRVPAPQITVQTTLHNSPVTANMPNNTILTLVCVLNLFGCLQVGAHTCLIRKHVTVPLTNQKFAEHSSPEKINPVGETHSYLRFETPNAPFLLINFPCVMWQRIQYVYLQFIRDSHNTVPVKNRNVNK